jgi:hypothetical protein
MSPKGQNGYIFVSKYNYGPKKKKKKKTFFWKFFLIFPFSGDIWLFQKIGKFRQNILFFSLNKRSFSPKNGEN